MRALLILLATGCGDVLLESSSPISAPSVTITAPLSGSIHARGMLTVTGTVSTATVVEVTIGGRTYAATSSGSSWSQTIDTTLLPVGPMMIEASAGTSSDSVTIELVQPPFTINATIAAGARSLQLRASSTHAGRIFYAVTSFDAGVLDSPAIRNLALSGGALASGVINAPLATHTSTARVSGLGEELPYWIYVSAESDTGGLLPNHRVLSQRHFTRARQSVLTLNATAPINYWAFFPDEYYFDEARDFPTMIFFAGVGELDDGSQHAIFKVLIHGPPMHIRNGQDYDMVVLSPQALLSTGYTVAWMHGFVEQALQAHRIDDRRIYVTGLSAGGNATWLYAQAHPERVASAVPIAGWLDDVSGACAMSGVPIWAFHGAIDDLIVPARARAPVDAINACVPAPLIPAQITIYPDGGHSVWQRTYDNSATPENIYDWMLLQQKP